MFKDLQKREESNYAEKALHIAVIHNDSKYVIRMWTYSK